MRSVRLAPFTVFLEFYLALYKLPILARPIVGAAALRACELYELILRHVSFSYEQSELETTTPA